MPIYAYKCESCGHAKDVLQKMSDPLLTDCPVCGKASFKKQLTAAGFQLKGTGWYVTDFREGGGAKSAPAVDAAVDASAPKSDASIPASSESSGKVVDTVSSTTATPASVAPVTATVAAKAASATTSPSDT